MNRTNELSPYFEWLDRHRPLLLGVSALLVASTVGCATTPSVSHSSDSQLKPSRYQTYRLVENRDGRPELDALASSAIHRLMSKRGYVRTDAPDSDLLVSYTILASPKTTWNGPPLAQEVASILSPGDGAPLGELIPIDFAPLPSVDKSVVVQLTDTRTMQVVWEGWARHNVLASDMLTGTAELLVQILARLPGRS